MIPWTTEVCLPQRNAWPAHHFLLQGADVSRMRCGRPIKNVIEVTQAFHGIVYRQGFIVTDGFERFPQRINRVLKHRRGMDRCQSEVGGEYKDVKGLLKFFNIDIRPAKPTKSTYQSVIVGKLSDKVPIPRLGHIPSKDRRIGQAGPKCPGNIPVLWCKRPL